VPTQPEGQPRVVGSSQGNRRRVVVDSRRERPVCEADIRRDPGRVRRIRRRARQAKGKLDAAPQAKGAGDTGAAARLMAEGHVYNDEQQRLNAELSRLRAPNPDWDSERLPGAARASASNCSLPASLAAFISARMTEWSSSTVWLLDGISPGPDRRRSGSETAFRGTCRRTWRGTAERRCPAEHRLRDGVSVLNRSRGAGIPWTAAAFGGSPAAGLVFVRLSCVG
jgi:hypothetical protein